MNVLRNSGLLGVLFVAFCGLVFGQAANKSTDERSLEETVHFLESEIAASEVSFVVSGKKIHYLNLMTATGCRTSLSTASTLNGTTILEELSPFDLKQIAGVGHGLFPKEGDSIGAATTVHLRFKRPVLLKRTVVSETTTTLEGSFVIIMLNTQLGLKLQQAFLHAAKLCGAGEVDSVVTHESSDATTNPANEPTLEDTVNFLVSKIEGLTVHYTASGATFRAVSIMSASGCRMSLSTRITVDGVDILEELSPFDLRQLKLVRLDSDPSTINNDGGVHVIDLRFKQRLSLTSTTSRTSTTKLKDIFLMMMPSKELGVRVEKAFRHAATLCGADKPEPF